MAPADRTWMAQQLAGLFACYPPSDMPRVAWQAAIAAYLESLAHWPRDIAAQAFRQARETCKFRPTIAEIVEIGEPLMARRRRTLAPDPPRLPAPERKITSEQLDEIMAPWRKRWGIPAGGPITAPKVEAASRHERKKAEGHRMFEQWCRDRGMDPDAPPAGLIPA